MERMSTNLTMDYIVTWVPHGKALVQYVVGKKKKMERQLSGTLVCHFLWHNFNEAFGTFNENYNHVLGKKAGKFSFVFSFTVLAEAVGG